MRRGIRRELLLRNKSRVELHRARLSTVCQPRGICRPGIQEIVDLGVRTACKTFVSLEHAKFCWKYPENSDAGAFGGFSTFRMMLVLIRFQIAGLIHISPAIGLELGVDIDLSAELNFTYGATAQVC